MAEGPCYPSALLLPKSPQSGTAPKPGRECHQVCCRGQGCNQHHGAKRNPDRTGATGKKRQGMVTHEETRLEKGNLLRSCGELLPDEGRSQEAAQLLPKSLLRCTARSRLAADLVPGCSARLAGSSARPVGSGCFQARWKLTGLPGTPPSCREPHLEALPAGRCVGDSTLPAPSSSPPAAGPARRKGSRWPLASTSCIPLNIVFRLHVLFGMKQTCRRK